MTIDLDAIQARRESYLEGCSAHDDCLRSDMAALLALVREQQAQIERVQELAAAWHMRGENDIAYSKAIPDEDRSRKPGPWRSKKRLLRSTASGS